MKTIAGIWPGHDTSICILQGGKPIFHSELERHTRLKHDHGDPIAFGKKFGYDETNIDVYATCFPASKLQKHADSWNSIHGKRPVYAIGHHEAHAAHAFYSSKFDNAVILTLDGGGVESASGEPTATTISYGADTEIRRLRTLPLNYCNIGGLWTRVVRYIFKMQNGWPLGDQAGSVMALATFGDPQKYVEDFRLMLTRDLLAASHKPAGQPEGAYVKGKDPVHPYLDKWSKLADSSEQEMMDLAAGLQLATEEIIRELIGAALNITKQSNSNWTTENLCIAGGVALNTVAMGKIKTWFPEIKNIYIPVCPGDSGLSIGAAQYVYHTILKNPRVKWDDNMSPYLGASYSEEQVLAELEARKDKVEWRQASDDEVIQHLLAQDIVCIFNGRAESGHRALGDRSIVCDPRSPDMKDNINKKVKHRQHYRPFAPSILREEVTNWFVEDCESPYMQFVVPFKEEKKKLVPAVCHVDGTGRLQTVTETLSPWWYNFIKKWHAESGVPMLLNTSFNSQEPICEEPKHAIDCFLRTSIELLYFPEHKIIVSKR